jgi:hypothetical protein
MHYLTVLLCQAENKNNALKKCRSFLKPYYDKEYDFYVVGGRWSGLFTAWGLDKKLYKKVCEQFKKEYGWWTNCSVSKKTRAKQFEEIFRKYFPDFQGNIPEWRDQYEDNPCNDDIYELSNISTKNLKNLIEPAKSFNLECGFYNIETKDQSIPRNKKGWFGVIIDMHN